MIQKIDACLKERGYSFIKVSPEEVGVYYRFTEGRAQVVAGVFMHPGFVLETEKLQAIQTKLQELFLIRKEGFRAVNRIWQSIRWSY